MLTPTLITAAGARRSAASCTAAARGISTFTRSYPSFQVCSASSQPRAAAAFFQQSYHPCVVALSTAESSHTAQRKWKSLSAAAALAGIISIYSVSSTDSIRLDAVAASGTGSRLTSLSGDVSKQVVVDADTNLSFPLYMRTPASLASDEPQPRLRLVGLGVRTVSFLRVRVYVAALYMDESALHFDSSAETIEQHMKHLLDQGTPAVIRIVPVRNTDFNHLRDGFIRALQNRLKKAIRQSQIDASHETQFQQEIQHVKDAFPKGSVPKGSPLDCVIVPSGNQKPARSGLVFEYGGEVFGQDTARDELKHEVKPVDASFTVARELVLAYFAEQGEISTPFKKSVADALLVQKQLPTSQ